MRTEAIDWLGVLATEEEIRNNNLGRSNCIVNKWDTLQFYLKVISRMPGQASNTQYVVCYSNRLDNEAIVDNGAYDEDVRIDDYVKQLKNYFFRFNYEENQAGYFVAKNIDAINLSEDYYPGKGFTTIPMIVSKHPVYPNDRVYDNFEELENALKNDEYVSKLNKYNTSGLDNIPYLIFHNTETLEYRIIGNFTGSELIKSQEWYSQIQPVNSLVVPHVLIFDVRYNAFYKMYKELQQNNVSIRWSENYAYSWKLSSKMYEIWCFIKMCRFLISDEIGFEARGWIFDEFRNESILIPDLVPGTKVEFHKENIKIKVYYDSTIPGAISSTNKENAPVFAATKHTRPDIKFDLYKDDIYWCSLIFEVKYRNIQKLWAYNDSKCKEQIRAYKNDYKSKYCRGLDPEFVVRKVNPVDRVWVLNPSHSSEDVINKKNEGIKFVQLIPGEDHSNIITELQEEINMALGGELI